jgi:putative endonuclease
MKEYYVYMMTNRSRVVLYTGVTSRLEHRAWEHKNHVVEGFTSKYKLDRLVYYEQFSDPVSAITREKEIKSWRREKKNELVRKLNPKWEDLSESLLAAVKKFRAHRGDREMTRQNRTDDLRTTLTLRVSSRTAQTVRDLTRGR